MKKLVVSALLVGMVLSSGCASMLVASSSKDKVQRRAIVAQQLPGGGVGIGIDLLSWDVLTEQPVMQLGAAVIDAATLYGGYLGVKSLQDQTAHKNKTTAVVVTGNGNNTTIVNGDGNGNNGAQDNSSKSGN